jgi:hypothetical protein
MIAALEEDSFVILRFTRVNRRIDGTKSHLNSEKASTIVLERDRYNALERAKPSTSAEKQKNTSAPKRKISITRENAKIKCP